MNIHTARPSLNRACTWLFTSWLLALGLTAQGQTLLYQWNFDNAATTAVTNITVAPTAIDSADGYIGGTLTSLFNTGNTLATPAGSGLYGVTNSADAGLFNSAANQTTSGVLVGGVGDLSAITNQFTVTFWFKLSAAYAFAKNARMVDIDSHTANGGIGSADGNELFISLVANNAFQVGVIPGTEPVSQNYIFGTNTLAGSTNIWVFMAFVYTNSSAGTFGVYSGTTNAVATLAQTLSSVGALAAGTNWNNTTNLVLIGNRSNGSNRNLPGTIDDVRIYREALTLPQIQAVQNVFSPPSITLQPAPDLVFPGQSPKFKVTASGSAPLTYQWMRNNTNLLDGGNISGSASAVLTISGVSTADAFDNYQVVITNSGGAVTSSVASLSLATTNGAYEAAVLTNVPFAFYTFSETADPSAGNAQANDSMGVFNGTYGTGNDPSGSGTLNGADGIAGPQATADGLIGFADTNTALFATFSDFPVDSYVTAPPFNLNNGAGANILTITAWIKPLGTEVHGAGIVFSRSGTTVAGLNYNATNSDGNLMLGYNWNTEVATYTWDSGLEPTPGIWSLVALVITPTNSTIYLVNANGLQFSTQAHTNVLQKFEGPTLIGNDIQDTTGKRNFEGSIDEVALFGQALTANQMSALYAAASGTVFAPQPPAISVAPAWSAPVYPGQPASVTVSSIGGTAFQWEAGTGGVYASLTNGANISGSTSPTLVINSVQASNALDYIVVITNAFGAITSAPPATLTITPAGPPLNFTLDLGGTPIVQPNGAFWNTVNNWNPNGQAASVSVYANPGSTYEVVVGARLRSPDTNNAVFPGTGTTLVVDGGGVYENSTLANVGELRIKHQTSSLATNFYSHLVLNGGEVDDGDVGRLVLRGWLDVESGSVFYTDSTNDSRSVQIDSRLTGSGSLFWHYTPTLDHNLTNDLQITGTTNTFTGQWIVDQGGLLGTGANSLGTNNINVGASGLVAAVETLYDLNNTSASLILGANGQVYLHQNDHFASVSINGVPLASGIYSFAALNSAYPANFPAAWPSLLGSTFSTGSGQIVVGNASAVSVPKINGIHLSGTALSLSVTNGTPGGSWTLLQSTNVALPLSQWQTGIAGTFDDGGNLSTNIAGTATNGREFYILKVK